jgi:ATP-binding cassette subfamily F protein 3
VLELGHARKAYGELVVLNDINLHVERGDRIALVAPNGAGKSTLMRVLAGVEPPDRGTRREGHQVVMQYFAQDEANRLDPVKTVYETMESDSPVGMVPMIRNILGGFLFSGDDIYKKAGVLSGGERTRLAVARMLLRPANTLLLDEPTNHLDIDSKDVLLDALEDFGGTLIFVSHDRYFVDKLATKIVSVGHGAIEVYPGTYEQFLWSRTQRQQAGAPPPSPGNRATPTTQMRGTSEPRKQSKAHAAPPQTYQEKKKVDAETRRRKRAEDERARRISELEVRITDREQAIKDLEAQMSAPGFYDNREAAETLVARHHGLMWEVGDLMNQWEALQETHSDDNS